MDQHDTMAPGASALHDVEANIPGLEALLVQARLEVRRQYAAEAVHRLKFRRQRVAAVLQRLMGEDVPEVEFADLVDELTVA